MEGDKAIKKTSGGARKFGRSKKKCQRYQDENRREKNKIRKWEKLIKKLSPDNSMRKQLEDRVKEVRG